MRGLPAPSNTFKADGGSAASATPSPRLSRLHAAKNTKSVITERDLRENVSIRSKPVDNATAHNLFNLPLPSPAHEKVIGHLPKGTHGPAQLPARARG